MFNYNVQKKSTPHLGKSLIAHPKKNKLKSKVNLALLIYDKMMRIAKINHLHHESRSDECGARVFIASHFNRHNCGKCYLTYCFNKPADMQLIAWINKLFEKRVINQSIKTKNSTKQKQLWPFIINFLNVVQPGDSIAKINLIIGTTWSSKHQWVQVYRTPAPLYGSVSLAL